MTLFSEIQAENRKRFANRKEYKVLKVDTPESVEELNHLAAVDYWQLVHVVQATRYFYFVLERKAERGKVEFECPNCGTTVPKYL